MPIDHPFPHWQRFESFGDTTWSTPVELETRNEASNVGSLLVRTYLKGTVGVTVLPTTPPPADWIAAVSILVCAHHDPDSSGGAISPESDDPSIILTGKLYPRFVPALSTSVKYHVLFEMVPAQSSRSQRKALDEVSAFPSVLVSTKLIDPNGALADVGGYTVDVTRRFYLENLWYATA